VTTPRRPVLAGIACALVVARCAAPGATPVDAVICPLVPTARQVAVDIRTAISAADSGDDVTRAKAAAAARDAGWQIIQAVTSLNGQATSTTNAVMFVGMIGEQGGSFYYSEPGQPWTANALPANVASIKAGVDKADRSLVQIKADLEAAGQAACWGS
jgi:hypothetical protein